MTAEGRQFIDGFWFVPMGLVKAWVGEYGATATKLVALGTAFGVGIGSHYVVHWASVLANSIF